MRFITLKIAVTPTDEMDDSVDLARTILRDACVHPQVVSGDLVGVGEEEEEGEGE